MRAKDTLVGIKELKTSSAPKSFTGSFRQKGMRKTDLTQDQQADLQFLKDALT